MADTSKTNVDTMTKLIQTDKDIHAEAFPTESRMRQKVKEAEQKKDGTINTGRQKRIKDIEDHHDDCGNDLNSLLPFLGEKFDGNLDAYLQSVLTEAPEWYFSGDFQAF